MTAQIMERIFYNEEEYGMACEPLGQYLEKKGIQFVGMMSSCWRGYVGTWELKNDRLYLIGLNGLTSQNSEVGLDFLFPGQSEVFAEWFSGEIRIPQGEMLLYVHMEFASIYEKDLILQFENGVLTAERIVDNREEFEDEL
jgi:hypothetical protein